MTTIKDGYYILVFDGRVRAVWRSTLVERDAGGARQVDLLEPLLDLRRVDRRNLVSGRVILGIDGSWS
jgi:hypothetical protein